MSHLYFDYQAWNDSTQVQYEANQRRMKRRHRNQARALRIWFEAAIAKHGNHWIGPAKVRFPWHGRRPLGLDQVNYCTYDCSEGGDYHCTSTLLGTNKPPLTEAEYREKMAEQGPDGEWYYQGCWDYVADIGQLAPWPDEGPKMESDSEDDTDTDSEDKNEQLQNLGNKQLLFQNRNFQINEGDILF